MDEYTRTLHDAVDAAAAGDRQALYMAQWLLSDLRCRINHSQDDVSVGNAAGIRSSTPANAD